MNTNQYVTIIFMSFLCMYHNLSATPELAHAAQRQDFATVEHLVKAGYQNINEIYGAKKWTALHYAAHYQCPSIIQLLLDAEADPNTRDKSGRTPLHLAVQNHKNSFASVISLAKHPNTDINASDELGWTALHYATSLANFWRSYDIMDYLLRCEANPNIAAKSGKTPLHFAVNGDMHKASSKNTARLLMHPNTEVNAQTNKGFAVLHWATRNGDTKMVQRLLKAGADPNIENNNGETPLNLINNMIQTTTFTDDDDVGNDDDELTYLSIQKQLTYAASKQNDSPSAPPLEDTQENASHLTPRAIGIDQEAYVWVSQDSLRIIPLNSEVGNQGDVEDYCLIDNLS